MKKSANHRGTRLRRLCAAVLFLGAEVLAAPVWAQDQVFWTPSCRVAADDAARMICSLTQDVRREGGGELLFRLEAERGERSEDTAFRVISPLGTYLINGIGLVVDGTELARLPVERCARQGCLSLVRSSPELEAILAGLRAGSTLELVFWLDASETKSVTLPLAGFAANWDRLADKL